MVLHKTTDLTVDSFTHSTQAYFLQAVCLNPVLPLSLFLHVLLHSFFLPSSLSFPSFLVSDSQDKLCLPHHILEEKGLVKVCVTVQALVDEASSKPPLLV
ncbi:hypothetical protein XENORESO_006849 [Xenotaenia resolanae]|uniref:Uncharacterized protein n=1 Tax=Xenotaenia resolanae TaxID=208358 RepID=A0ABV0W1G5_9TELE